MSDAVEIERLARGYVNVWVVHTDTAAIIVDTHYARAEGWLERRLERRDVKGLSAIVVTHAHGDHAGGALALHERLGVPVILGASDDATTQAGHNPPIHPTSLLARFVKPSIPQRFPAFTASVLVADRLDLRAYGIPGEAVVLGGHTAGSLVVQLDGGDVLVGDLVRGGMLAHHHPTEHLYQPDVAPVHALLDQLLDAGAVRLYPGHGDVLEAADVRKWLDRQD